VLHVSYQKKQCTGIHPLLQPELKLEKELYRPESQSHKEKSSVMQDFCRPDALSVAQLNQSTEA